MIRRKRNRLSPSVDITPMIDVTFMVVIFFMLTSTFVLQPGIEIKLPKAVTRDLKESKELVVVLTKDGDLFLNREKVTPVSLYHRLENDFRDQNLIIIMADRDVKHHNVVEVMDIAKQVGIKRIAIATDVKEAEN
ncbi:MAG: biopolymer transporter ExbD [Candidatus Firestonebacteria bacterium]|nr:biopolymer transporter ExbD [Candidatus Firestonebacteria bacterium]